MLNAVQIGVLLATAVLSASAQLCFKKGSGGGKGGGLLRILDQPWLLLGIILMVINVLAFIWVLRKVPLTAAMPFVAMVYVLVPLGARYFFFRTSFATILDWSPAYWRGHTPDGPLGGRLATG